MPTMSGRTSIATGLNTGNVVLGQQYELAPFDALVEIAAISTVNLVTIAVLAGSDILQQPGGGVPVNSVESMPKYPDDYHWEDHVRAGDRISLSFQNGNAATAIINWVVRFSPA